MRDIWARIFYGLAGFGAVVGVLFSSWVTVADSPSKIAYDGSVPGDAIQANPELFESVLSRGLNTFTYFTILSNVLVAVVCIILMTNPHKAGKVFNVFRLFSLVAITITGIVYNTVLRALAHPEGFAAFETNIVHVFVPIMAVLGWLIFGPRIKFEWPTVWWCAAIGMVWIVFTFIRGAIIDWYPYPFLNVDYLGFGQAALACAVILAVAIGFAIGILALDKKLPGDKPWLDAESKDASAAVKADSK